MGIGGQPRLEIQVYCEHGSLVLDQTAGRLRARHHDGTEQTCGPPAPADAYPREAPVNNLVDVILGRDENRSLPSVGVTTVELLEAAYQSAAHQGRPVHIASLVKSASRSNVLGAGGVRFSSLPARKKPIRI